MTADEFKEASDFDKNLVIGQEVVVRWTWCHRYYRGKAKVIKLNQKSLRVELLEDCGEYKAGNTISVPRFYDIQKWSPNNSVWKE